MLNKANAADALECAADLNALSVKGKFLTLVQH